MKHYNPSITERANRIFNLKNGDGMSEEIDGPVAVISINPSIKVVKRSIVGGTIYTTPTNSDFYLTGAQLCVCKVAADTGSNNAITVVIDGVSINILDYRGVTLTADNQSLIAHFTLPLKIDRGTNITLSPTGNWTSQSATIFGYLEEVTRT